MARAQFSLSKQNPSKQKQVGAKNGTQKRKPQSPPINHKTNQENQDVSGTCKSYKRKLDMVAYDGEATRCVMGRANEVLKNLQAEFPCFVKAMLSSHVSGGFWLGLPKKFCVHLPNHDSTVILEDESGRNHVTKYLAEKTGLSAGWRGFSIHHKLIEGDVLVFQLVKHCKFKVYVVRSNSLTELDGALGLLNLDSCARVDFEGNYARSDTEVEDVCFEPLAIEAAKKTTPKVENVETGLGVWEGIKLSESDIVFKDVKSTENFCILVNGIVIDSEFSVYVRTKYYELCCSQKAFLHDHLLQGLNCKLIAGIISETVNIADAIRASKATISQEDLVLWDKTLEAFEALGMKVQFLRARLERLQHIAFQSQEAAELKRIQRVTLEEEVRTMKARLLEVNETKKRLDAEIEALKISSKRLEVLVKEEASAPW